MTLLEYLNKLEELEYKARKAPWYVGHVSEINLDAADIDSADGTVCDYAYGGDNRNFIIEARSAVPKLVRMLRVWIDDDDYYAAKEKCERILNER